VGRGWRRKLDKNYIMLVSLSVKIVDLISVWVECCRKPILLSGSGWVAVTVDVVAESFCGVS